MTQGDFLNRSRPGFLPAMCRSGAWVVSDSPPSSACPRRSPARGEHCGAGGEAEGQLGRFLPWGGEQGLKGSAWRSSVRAASGDLAVERHLVFQPALWSCNVCALWSAERGTLRSARVPTSSTAWHHAACPMQMKWLSNFSALSTPLRTNLPARLKRSFLCSSLTFVLPRAAWGWEQSPRLLWAHGTPVPPGLSPMPQPCANGTSCIPGALVLAWPGGAQVPRCHHWGSAPLPRAPCSAVVQPSLAGTITTAQHRAQTGACWLGGAPGCSCKLLCIHPPVIDRSKNL